MSVGKAKKNLEAKRLWHLVDAQGMVLGRLASAIALLLQGKHKSHYLRYLDQGDWVVVTNARGLRVTGAKMSQKKYQHYTGYPGGLRTRVLGERFASNPAAVLSDAVRGMLPKNKLGTLMLKRLKIFGDEKHPYQSKFKA